MTTTDTDLEALHAQLDITPSDQFTRCVLADWYLDAGDMVMADGLRWMAERKRRPINYLVYGWLWSNNEYGFVTHRSPNDIGGPVGPLVVREMAAARAKPHSRRAAEEALCRALADVQE